MFCGSSPPRQEKSPILIFDAKLFADADAQTRRRFAKFTDAGMRSAPYGTLRYTCDSEHDAAYSEWLTVK